MKRSTKIISVVIIFFLIIATVIIARTMIGNHFKKKFGKRPPPGIMVTEVVENRFFEKIETFGTAVSNRNDSFRIKKDELLEELDLNNFVNKGDVIVKLKSGDIIAPFSGVLGYTGLTEDIFVSDKTIIITLDDTKVIYSDIKIPENYSSVIQTGLPIEAKVSSFKDKTFNGEIDFISSRINADTRSLLTRIKIDNSNYELISGSLLEVSIIFNLRNSLGVPDTSVMMEGDKAFVYRVSPENVANKIEVQIGNRSEGKVEILSGLNEGDIIVAEGLRKVFPRAKINPIKEGEEKNKSSWKKKENNN
jgi:membrane fusion protein (multidrug efflux system)